MGEQVDWDDIVGVAEVAQMLDLKPATVRQYRRRGTIPQPRRELSDKCLLWKRQDIEAEARRRASASEP